MTGFPLELPLRIENVRYRVKAACLLKSVRTLMVEAHEITKQRPHQRRPEFTYSRLLLETSMHNPLPSG